LTLNDNFGFMIAKLFRAPTTGANSTGNVLRREDTGALFGTSMYQTNSNSTIFNDEAGINQAQVGEGSTPATRQDFKIEDTFPDSPESSPQNSVAGAYNSGLGKITIATLISPTGGAGSITEVIKRGRIRDSIGGSTTRFIIWTRDVISPVGFIIGQSINIDHEVQI